MNDQLLRRLLRAVLPFLLLLGGCQEPGGGERPATQLDAAVAPGADTDHRAHQAGPAAAQAEHPADPGAARADGPADPTSSARSLPGYSVVTVDPSRQQLIGLRTGQVTRRSFSRILRTVGLVTTDETSTAHVHVKFAGWVEDVFVDFVGKTVKRGQPLMSIYSPELWTAQNEYIQALQSAERQIQSGGGTLEGTAARANQELLEAARHRLKLWDIPDPEIQRLEQTRTPKRTLTLHAPISGTVLVRNVLKGMYVDPGTHLYILANLSKVWVRAQVYEHELPYVRVGQQATLTFEALPGRDLEGEVKFIQPTLSESTRTNEVRLELDNRDGSLKPNMFATVALKLDMGEGLALPEEAVIDTGVRKLIFVARDDRTFEPREVKLGTKVEDHYQVLEGVAEGERVVISAQFLLDSESQIKGAAGMGGAHTGHGG